MKTIAKITQTLVVSLALMANVATAQAQMSPYKFEQVFKQAFAQVLAGDYQEAIPLLESLNSSDGEHAQVQYLLALCQMNSGTSDKNTTELLQNAAMRYDYFHQSGNASDRTAPAKVWFLLGERLAAEGRTQKAVEAYRNYMSCVPLASIDHKRMVIEKIAAQKAQKQDEVGAVSLLASRKP